MDQNFIARVVLFRGEFVEYFVVGGLVSKFDIYNRNFSPSNAFNISRWGQRYWGLTTFTNRWRWTTWWSLFRPRESLFRGITTGLTEHATISRIKLDSARWYLLRSDARRWRIYISVIVDERLELWNLFVEIFSQTRIKKIIKYLARKNIILV